MLVAHCTLENKQVIVRVSVQKPKLFDGSNHSDFSDSLTDFRGLVDTGAQRSCVSHHVIAAASLSRHGHKLIRSVNHEKSHSLFFASIGFWPQNILAAGESPPKTFFALPQPTEVIDIDNNDSFDVLIGMDILSEFDFSYRAVGQLFELKLRA